MEVWIVFKDWGAYEADEIVSIYDNEAAAQAEVDALTLKRDAEPYSFGAPGFDIRHYDLLSIFTPEA